MRPSHRTSFGDALVFFLFGPVIALVHFMVVYLFAEVVCTGGWLRFEALGVPSVILVTLVVTVLGAAATVLLARAAYRRRSSAYGELAFIGYLLGVLFAVAILFIGVPPVFLSPC